MHRSAICLAIACACARPVARAPEELGQAMPADLEATSPRGGEVREFAMRVWVDAAYRKAVPGWKELFSDHLDYANQLLVPLLGIRLEPSFEAWDAGGQTELPALLADLEAKDKGKGVGLVMGLVAPSPAALTDLHQLGESTQFGRHLVVRGYAAAAERAVAARIDPSVTGKGRELLTMRRRHKQAVVMLHHIGHALGAIHTAEPSWIMYPTYSTRQATVADRNRELMRLSADHRLSREPDALLIPRLLAAIEASEWGGWNEEARVDAVERLRARVIADREGTLAPAAPATALAQIERTRGLIAASKYREAAAELEALTAAYPGNAAVRLVACQLALAQHGPADQRAASACASAAEAAPADPTTALAIAAAWIGKNDPAKARAQLALAATKAGELTRTSEQAARDIWLRIADLHQRLGDLSYTEVALDAALAPLDHPGRAWAAQLRTRYGLPRNAESLGIAPDDEADYIATVKAILDAVYRDRFGDAEKLAKTGEARWAGGPGLAAARCDLDFRRGNLDRARAHCRAAIAAFDGGSWAHYLLGVLALRGPTPAEGIASLRRAIEVDPDLMQAWRALAKGLERQKDKAALDQLRDAYRQRFGQALP